MKSSLSSRPANEAAALSLLLILNLLNLLLTWVSAHALQLEDIKQLVGLLGSSIELYQILLRLRRHQ